MKYNCLQCLKEMITYNGTTKKCTPADREASDFL